jgi:hypothetical protein
MNDRGSGGAIGAANFAAGSDCDLITNPPPGRYCCKDMRTTVWIRALAVAALMASACSSPAPVGNVASPTASPSAPATPAATPAPTPVRSLALVTLHGSNSFVVRDLTDINHPRSVSNLGGISGPVFVSGTEISYASDTSLFRMPLSGSPRTLVVKGGGTGDWSPDGTAVVYTTYKSTDSCAGTTTVHQLKGGHDQVLGSVPSGGCYDCQTISNCGISQILDFRLLYSPDGSLISLVTTGIGASAVRLWSSDGKVLESSDVQGSTMSAWSGASLYYDGEGNVESWHDGVTSIFMANTFWVRPSASPAGGQIVYTVRDSRGWGHVRIVDTATGMVHELKADRTNAVFLTARYVWYQGERACISSDICGARPPFHPLSGKAYIYDLQTGTETQSIITSVSDVWPHPA